MTEAKDGDQVQVHYVGRYADGPSQGQIFDSSRNREPLSFKLGAGEVLTAFENAIVGLAPGQTATFTVECDDAYGPRRDELMLEMPRGELPDALEVGQSLVLSTRDGTRIPAVVSEIEDASVVLDANHPLAGEDLIFEVELLEVA